MNPLPSPLVLASASPRRRELLEKIGLSIQGKVLGKPESPTETDSFLSLLSGKVHRVITSLSLSTPQIAPEIHVESEVTEIRMASISEEERSWYIGTGEWRGAAGGYRIQGRGSLFVERIEGCYFNVMGLPLNLFYGMVQRHGYGLLQALSGTSSAV